MLYKIDYVTRNGLVGEKFVNHAADSTEAVSRFMEWFFKTHEGDAVRIDHYTEISIVGDLSAVDVIDAAVGEKEE